MELTFKQISLIRRSLIPQVEDLQATRVWAKGLAAAAWEGASPDTNVGVSEFHRLNFARDTYRKATADLAVTESILAECKREERRLQKRNSLNMEWDRLYLRMREINEQLDQI
jgi:hypothetical protein